MNATLEQQKEKTILWLSRHQATETQIQELQQIFNTKINIIQIGITINDAKEIVDLIGKYKCNEIVAVLPIHILARLVEYGIKPIHAVMKRIIHTDGGVTFEHDYFERVKKIDVISQKLTPREVIQ